MPDGYKKEWKKKEPYGCHIRTVAEGSLGVRKCFESWTMETLKATNNGGGHRCFTFKENVSVELYTARIEASKVKLLTYLKEKVLVLGGMNAVVAYEDQKTTLPLIMVSGPSPLPLFWPGFDCIGDQLTKYIP